MDTPHAPVGLIKTVIVWFYDLVMEPTRIAKLAKIAEEADDIRPKCTACGRGRVAVYGRQSPGFGPDAGAFTLGTCEVCKFDWRMTDDGLKLERP